MINTKTKNKLGWVSVGMGLMLAAGCGGLSIGSTEPTGPRNQDSGGVDSPRPELPAESGPELRKDRYAFVVTSESLLKFDVADNGALSNSAVVGTGEFYNVTVTEDGQYVLVLTKDGLTGWRFELDASEKLTLKPFANAQKQNFHASHYNSVVTKTGPNGTFVYAQTDTGVFAFKIEPDATEKEKVALKLVDSRQNDSTYASGGVLLVNNTLYAANEDTFLALPIKKDGTFEQNPTKVDSPEPIRFATTRDKTLLCVTSTTQPTLSCFKLQSDGSLTPNSQTNVALTKAQGWDIVFTLNGRFAYVSHSDGFLTRLQIQANGLPKEIGTSQLTQDSKKSKHLYGLALSRDGRVLYAMDSDNKLIWMQQVNQDTGELTPSDKAPPVSTQGSAYALALTLGPQAK